MAGSKSGTVPPPEATHGAGAYPPKPEAPARPRKGGRTQQGRTTSTALLPAATPTAPATSPASTAPAPSPDDAPASSTQTTKPARSASRPGAAIGGIIAGLFLWPAVVNWLRGGQAQAIGWFGAKFFNEPYGGGTGSATGGGQLGGALAGAIPGLIQAAQNVAANTPKPNTTLGGRVGTSSQKQT